MTAHERIATIASISLILAALFGLFKSPDINAWEKANGYPFGKFSDICQYIPCVAAPRR